jgi:hypothetical protein
MVIKPSLAKVSALSAVAGVTRISPAPITALLIERMILGYFFPSQ